MPESIFQKKIRQCTNPACSFRYPVTEKKFDKDTCPVCGSPAIVAGHYANDFKETPWNKPPAFSFDIILDNLRSIFNVGSIFRTSDGTSIVNTLHLCGITPTPEHPKMKKTSLGAENSVNWQYHRNALDLCHQLKNAGKILCAIEITDQSKSLYSVHSEFFCDNNLVLIFGNEVAGVDPEILSLCDYHIGIPMHGIKESLNVSISFSICLYHLYFLLS